VSPWVFGRVPRRRREDAQEVPGLGPEGARTNSAICVAVQREGALERALLAARWWRSTGDVAGQKDARSYERGSP